METNPAPPPRRSKTVEGILQAEKLTQIAVILPAAVFVGWLLGGLLNRLTGQHWIDIAGLLVGGAAGLVHVIRLVLSSDGGSRPRS